MSSRNIGGVYAELSMRDDKFRKTLTGAKLKLADFGRGAVGVGAKVAKLTAATAAATAAAATAAAVAGTRRTIEMGAELDHLASQTGVAVSSLMTIGQAYKDAGKNAADAGKDINKMQKSIADAADNPGGESDPFTAIGLSAAKLMEMSPENQFFAIGEAIDSITNQTRKAQAAMDIFGRSGGELLTVFQGSDLDDIAQSLGRMPEVMEEFSGALERADTLLGRLPNKSDQFFTGFTAGVVGDLLPSLELIDDKDFTQLGQNIGEAVADGFELLISGDVWEIFLLHAEKAMESLRTDKAGGVMNAWAAGINATWDQLTNREGWIQGGDVGFWDSFDKFAMAGLEDSQQRVAELDAELERIFKKHEARRNTDPLFGPDLPPVLEMAAAAMSGVPVAAAAAGTDFDSPVARDLADMQFNSMQARGLAQGAVQISRGEQKQITTLEKILAVLENPRPGDRSLFWP